MRNGRTGFAIEEPVERNGKRACPSLSLDGSEANARSIGTAYVYSLYSGGQIRRPQCVRGEIRMKF
jgi:hypothetical protein